MRVLIVDPSKALQRFIRELLENFSFDPDLIKCADSPEAALAIARKLHPDFLLTDWYTNAPLTGLGLFRAIQELAPLCQLALLGAQDDPELTAQSEEAWTLFTLPKPCTPADLRKAIGSAVKEIAVRNPQVDSDVPEKTLTAQRHLNALKYASQSPRFKPGDRVRYQGKIETVRHVLLRRGEVALQLDGEAGTVLPEAVEKL